MLLRKIESIEAEIKSLKMNRWRNPNRQSSRNRSNSRSRNSSHKYCWYHYTFGERSRKCTQPCEYSPSDSDIHMLSPTITASAKLFETSVNKNVYRLFVTDNLSKISFLIDTGADVSVIPAKFRDKKYLNSVKVTLQSANGSRINVYGERTLVIDLGLRRRFTWTFIIHS